MAGENERLLASFLDEVCQNPEGKAAEAFFGDWCSTSGLKPPHEYLAFFARIGQALGPFNIDLEDVMASQDIVRYAATLRGASKASKVAWRIAGVAKIVNQKIVAATHYADLFSLLRQLGTVPAEDALVTLEQTEYGSIFAPFETPTPAVGELLALCDASNLGAIITSGSDDQILSFNSTSQRLLGELQKQNKPFPELLVENEREKEQIRFRELVDGIRTSYRERLCFQRNEPRVVIWLAVSAITVQGDNGDLFVLRALTEATLGKEAIEFFENQSHNLSREIHDTIAQDSAALWMLVQSENANGTRIQDVLLRLKNELLVLRDEIRASTLDLSCLATALEELKHNFLAEFGFEFGLEIDSNLDLSDELSLTIFRVIQEALRNVANHSAAQRAKVRLRRDKGRVIGEVEDFGRGFKVDSYSERYGLIGMRERCESLGGSFRISSEIGSGTLVRFELPR